MQLKLNKYSAFENYLISFLIHLIILLALAFVTLKQSENAKELVVDWLLEENQPELQEDFTPVGSPVRDNARDINKIRDNQPSAEKPLVDNKAPEHTTPKSIEPPVTKKESDVSGAPVSGTNSSYLSGVKTQLSGDQQGNSGYQLDDDDGNITILKSVLPEVKISDYGKITLQFKIRANGTVNSESILPVLLDDPIYTEASIKALKQWLFSVKNYNSNKAYRITFIFKPE